MRILRAHNKYVLEQKHAERASSSLRIHLKAPYRRNQEGQVKGGRLIRTELGSIGTQEITGQGEGETQKAATQPLLLFPVHVNSMWPSRRLGQTEERSFKLYFSGQ